MDQARQFLRLIVRHGSSAPALPNRSGQVVQAGHRSGVIDGSRHLVNEHA
jgi:hypothetical protein